MCGTFATRLATAIVALCAGCVSYEPSTLHPPSELASLVRRSTAVVHAPARARSLEELVWFPLERHVDPSDGLTLPEANSLALVLSPGVIGVRGALGISEAEAEGAGLLANPTLFVGPRWSTSGAGLILPVSLSWRLPLGGQREAEREGADAVAERSRWLLLSAELNALCAVRRGLIDLASWRARLGIERDRLERVTAIGEWVSTLERAGVASAVLVGLAQLAELEARAAAEQIELEIERTVVELRGSVGLLATAEVRLEPGPDAFDLPPLPAPAADRALGHPLAKAREAAYRAADQAYRLEVARQSPAVQIGPDGEGSEDDIEIGFGVTIPIPIFDRNRWSIASAKRRRDLARQRYREALLVLSADEARARAEVRIYARQLDRAETEGVPLAQRTLDATSARLAVGRASPLEALEAIDAAADAVARQVELRRRLGHARLRVVRAVGLEDCSHMRATGDTESRAR